MSVRVIVAGAGTGGLCLAQLLHRAGAEVVVLERDVDPGPPGCAATGSASPPTAPAPCGPVCQRSCTRCSRRVRPRRTTGC
ncbi:NAD(P)/FAD-dependent oxidoreductase [Pseudonocardia sp. ICBG601]|uniref:FAD-dependent oxidoreductase n=1 Tax=Pseudonocardia sp. ICBG601 TaxID=2846759 RepID=UPI001CF69019|nr:NAD(P)-binding protein [Pseudonocardia sp. ICBG601]